MSARRPHLFWTRVTSTALCGAILILDCVAGINRWSIAFLGLAVGAGLMGFVTDWIIAQREGR